MTRFARAKGSKSSNERLPLKATAWTEMKDQLEQKKKELQIEKERQEINKVRSETYKQFLKEVEGKKGTSTWVEFPQEIGITNNKTKKVKLQDTDEQQLSNGKTPKIKGKKKTQNGEMVEGAEQPNNGAKFIGKKQNEENNENEEVQQPNIEKRAKIKAKKKKKQTGGVEDNTKNTLIESQDESKTENNKVIGMTPNIPIEEMSEAELKKFKKKMERRQRQVQKRKEIKAKIAAMKQGDSNELEESVTVPTEKKVKKNKVVKENKQVVHKKSLEEMTEEELLKVNRRKEKRLRQIEKRKEIKAKLASESKDQNPVAVAANNKFPKKQPNNSKRKLSKEEDNKEHKKRKPNSQVDKVTINGKEIELAYVEGFPIKKEDAERLKELRKQMIIKGLPKSEVKAALKLERRRAEKALAREKKNVCFNCRKAGHVLSECPNLGDESVHSVASGICFKCGSTEHTHFECKVVKNPEFRFASCFICKEQGHIARQCPDNARGLYPKGGGCKLCGDVTHLKKDCPKFMEEQAGRSISLDTIGDDVEGLENRNTIPRLKKPVNKIVKF